MIDVFVLTAILKIQLTKLKTSKRIGSSNLFIKLSYIEKMR